MSKKLLEKVLLDGVQALASGTWVEVTSWRRLTIHVKGIVTATVQIRGSCAPTKPADASDEVQIGADITADSLIEITRKLKWVKAKVTAYSEGTLYAYAVGESTIYGL